MGVVVRIFTLLSWYDEQPAHLAQLVESVAPLCDGFVAVDGAYALYPSARRESAARACWALSDAVRAHGFDYALHTPSRPWNGGEVEKRAFMFEYALRKATPYEDWFLIMDADMLLGDCDVSALRAALAATDCDVAEVTIGELAYGSSTHTLHATGSRFLFRAVPSLTVEGTHWLYVVPDETRPAGRRFMWHGIVGNRPSEWKYAPEPALEAKSLITLLHRPHVRNRERVKSRQDYYANREQAVAERVPIYEEMREQ